MQWGFCCRGCGSQKIWEIFKYKRSSATKFRENKYPSELLIKLSGKKNFKNFVGKKSFHIREILQLGSVRLSKTRDGHWLS
jgi:hypothetical protein